MLHIQYIGLLNTDLAHKGPVRMFLQGGESTERYVLDRLPPWVEETLGQVRETTGNIRYMSGANLAMFHPEVRTMIYQSLVTGDYKVRGAHSGGGYVPVAAVFSA
jgi:hypothetical protein